MSHTLFAYTGAEVFDGFNRQKGRALLVQGGKVRGIVADTDIPATARITRLGGGLLAPGFVDLQVNGGGGVMFNTDPTPESIAAIVAAHLPFGTTALLTTLISDSKAKTEAAIAAAAKADMPGHIGLHLEGPHLSQTRHGAHDPALIRNMGADDLARLKEAAQTLPTLFVTVAPESTTPTQIATLVAAGAIVSLGHSNAQPDTLTPAIDAGATAATHLFNAMSQLQNRAPGLVGTAIDDGRISASIIADGIHVAPTALRIALNAKQGPGRIFLITDAMSSVGTDVAAFSLNGRTITRHNHRLSLEDGTLAGADLDMISAVRFVHKKLGVGLEEALRMAALYPAQVIGRAAELGCLKPGARADFIWLDAALDIRGVWQGGAQKH